MSATELLEADERALRNSFDAMRSQSGNARMEALLCTAERLIAHRVVMRRYAEPALAGLEQPTPAANGAKYVINGEGTRTDAMLRQTLEEVAHSAPSEERLAQIARRFGEAIDDYLIHQARPIAQTLLDRLSAKELEALGAQMKETLAFMADRRASSVSARSHGDGRGRSLNFHPLGLSLLARAGRGLKAAAAWGLWAGRGFGGWLLDLAFPETIVRGAETLRRTGSTLV